MDTLYAIYETYLLEIAIGTKFDGDVETWLIPVEAVKNTISYLYDLDGNSVQYDEFPIDKDNPDYFRYPVRSPSPVWAFIQWETLTINDSMCKFNVIFYDAPLDDSDRGEELRTFTYEFEQVLYKDSSPSKTVCYKFIGATRVK